MERTSASRIATRPLEALKETILRQPEVAIASSSIFHMRASRMIG